MYACKRIFSLLIPILLFIPILLERTTIHPHRNILKLSLSDYNINVMLSVFCNFLA